MSNTSFWNVFSKSKIIFFLKNSLLNKIISKNQWKRKFIIHYKQKLAIATGKMHSFLKVLATFCKEINETTRTLELREKENITYLLKKLKHFNAT